MTLPYEEAMVWAVLVADRNNRIRKETEEEVRNLRANQDED